MTALDDIIAGRSPRQVRKTVAPEPATVLSMSRQGMGWQQSFAPGSPIDPYRPPGSIPRQYNYPTGQNITTRPRAGLVSFETMRELTRNWDVAAMCIKHRIDSFRSFDWNITAADGATGDTDADVKQARKLMQRPDGKTPYASFVAKYLGDLFRYDAPTLYRRRNLFGEVIGLDVVSGPTIAPLIDYGGRLPDPPAPAYIQYANGVPWEWLTADDLIYEPFFPQSDSQYGRAPIEDVILLANTDIRMAIHLMEYWTDGSIPGGFFKPGPQMTDPAQVVTAQDDWDARVLGDQAKKQQIRYMPLGVDYVAAEKEAFDENAYLWCVRKGCAAFGVVPQDIGLTMDVNRANGETQMDVQERIGDRPLAMHVDGIWTRYLQEDHGLEVEFHTSYSAEKEDRLEEANAWGVYIDKGMASADEGRAQVLGLPVDNERPVPRTMLVGRTLVNLSSIYESAGPIDPETAGPTDTVILADTPVEGIPGVIPSPTLNTPGALMAGFNPDEPAFPGSELTATPPPRAVPAPVAKATTAGITSATGIEGVDLQGDEDEIPEDVTKELRKWRDNARTRIAQGRAPRQFMTDVIPDDTYARVWKALDGAKTREEVDAAFEVRKEQGPLLVTVS